MARILLSLLTIGLLTGAFYIAAYPISPNWIPWKTPELDDDPTLFTHLHINRLRLERGMCINVLEGADLLEFEPQADHTKGEACGFTNVVRANGVPTTFNYSPVATCPLIAALYWWNREVQALAIQHLGSPVVHIDQMGTYACRNVNSRTRGARSQHATANAIDIAAFHLADGRRVNVLRYWKSEGPEAAFLRGTRNAACRYFNGVLSPDYNSLHANHFHLDLGSHLICR